MSYFPQLLIFAPHRNVFIIPGSMEISYKTLKMGKEIKTSFCFYLCTCKLVSTQSTIRCEICRTIWQWKWKCSVKSHEAISLWKQLSERRVIQVPIVIKQHCIKSPNILLLLSSSVTESISTVQRADEQGLLPFCGAEDWSKDQETI